MNGTMFLKKNFLCLLIVFLKSLKFRYISFMVDWTSGEQFLDKIEIFVILTLNTTINKWLLSLIKF